jgi:hypothetical protein
MLEPCASRQPTTNLDRQAFHQEIAVNQKQAILRGLVIFIPVIATVIATAFALDRWWPTTYAGLIAGVVGSLAMLIGLAVAMRPKRDD